MMKTAFVLAIFLSAAAAASAREAVTVEGTVHLRNGRIAVSDGEASYFVTVFGRYVGFIEELRDGALVTVRGYASGNVLRPVSMTLGGRSFDLSGGFGGRGAGRANYPWNRQGMTGPGGGRGGQDTAGPGRGPGRQGCGRDRCCRSFTF